MSEYPVNMPTLIDVKAMATAAEPLGYSTLSRQAISDFMEPTSSGPFMLVTFSLGRGCN